MTSYCLTVADSPADLARRVTEQVALCIDQVLAQRGRALIALSGGQTPRSAYGQLSTFRLPWDRVDVLLGDERWVAADDPSSNALMIRETLLAQGPGCQACFHPVPTGLANPQESADAYELQLQALFASDLPCFDLMLLGLGDDGHTASLFPGTSATGTVHRWVAVGEGKGLPRITLTAPVLSAARKVMFLVSGAGKREALRRLMDPQESADRTPARLVRPDTEVLILADAAAAGEGSDG